MGSSCVAPIDRGLGFDRGVRASSVRSEARQRPEHLCVYWVVHYLSNDTCLMRPHSFYVIFTVSRTITICRLHYSTILKSTCVRQVVLDEWFPLCVAGSRGAPV